MSWQFARFLIVGVINTFTGISVIYLMKYLLSAGDVLANAVGYCIGLCVSFVLNRKWTFRHDGKVWPSAIKFILVFFVAYATNLAVVMISIHWVGIDSYIAHLVGMPPYTVVFFLLCQYFVFPNQGGILDLKQLSSSR